MSHCWDHKSTSECKANDTRTYMVPPHLQHHHNLFHHVYYCRLIRNPHRPSFRPLVSPVGVSKVSVLQDLSLGLHCQTKLLLRSCHRLGIGVLEVDVHRDVSEDGHDCRVQSLLGLSGCEWHCRIVRVVGIHRHTLWLLFPWVESSKLFLEYAHSHGYPPTGLHTSGPRDEVLEGGILLRPVTLT